MKRLGKLKDQAESYDSLVKRFDEVMKERQSIEAQLNKSKSAKGDSGEGDPLDQYMSVVSSQLDPATVTRLKRQSLSLRKEEEMIKKLMKVAKPTEMPSLQPSGITSASGEERLGGTCPATTTTVESSGGGEGQNRGVGGDRDGSTDQSGGGTDPAVSGTTGSVSPGQPTTGGGGDSSPMPPPSRSSRRRRRRSSSSSSGPEATTGGGEGAQKKSRVLGPALPQRDEPEQKKAVSETADPEFASWLPPENQTGDGRTYLNEKYGY
jgi:hypothetical protein